MFKPTLNTGGAITISDSHVFADTSARDTYFATHFDELVNNLYIYITDTVSLQQYKTATSSWIDMTPVLKGQDGTDGVDGESINVTVSASEPESASNGDIWVDTDETLSNLADDSVLWNGVSRPTFAGCGWRLMVLNSAASSFEFPTNVAIPGVPTATTAAINTNTTQLATTAYVYRVQPKTRQFNRCAYMTDSAGTEVKMNSCGSLDRASTVSVNGYKMYYFPFCAGGETTLDIFVSKGSTRPIIDIYVNNVLDSAGYDLYNSITVDATVTISLTQAITAGYNEIRIVVNGHNGSSTAYDTAIYGVRIR